eukprot:Skav228799  [mRNA]  locus=scaffold359:67964:74549:+ [translate_table: standard]
MAGSLTAFLEAGQKGELPPNYGYRVAWEGVDNFLGYTILYAYCQEEPALFSSLEAIAENFGAKDPKVSAAKSKFCVPLRVPVELAHKVMDVGPSALTQWVLETAMQPRRAMQQTSEAEVDKLSAGLKEGVKGSVVDEDGISALMMAATAGGAEACEVHHGTALMCAAQGGHYEAARKTQNPWADAWSEGSTELVMAGAPPVALSFP